jgi:hypothetical protein
MPLSMPPSCSHFASAMQRKQAHNLERLVSTAVISITPGALALQHARSYRPAISKANLAEQYILLHKSYNFQYRHFGLDIANWLRFERDTAQSILEINLH